MSLLRNRTFANRQFKTTCKRSKIPNNRNLQGICPNIPTNLTPMANGRPLEEITDVGIMGRLMKKEEDVTNAHVGRNR